MLPAAELQATLDPVFGPWVGVQTRTVVVGVANHGQLPADEVTATLEVPPGWAVDAVADTPNRTCATAPDSASITCTYEVLSPGSPEELFLPVTSPAGPSASGPATVTVSTPTPEHGDTPNTVTRTFEHVETLPPPTVAVTPSVDVVDGADVTVAVSGFPVERLHRSAQCEASVPLTLADCDLETIVVRQTDDHGAITFIRPVIRFIVTDSGLVDCAVEACVLAVAVLDLSQSASAPISFSDATVPSPLTVTIDAPAYTSTDGLSGATVPAILECDEAATVRLRFVLSQLDSASGLTRRGSSIVIVPCTPGTPAEVTSDLIGSMEPGPADVIIIATVEGTNARTITSGNISLEPFSAVLATLLARLADPTDTTVIPELAAALSWRLQYNPLWARRVLPSNPRPELSPCSADSRHVPACAPCGLRAGRSMRSSRGRGGWSRRGSAESEDQFRAELGRSALRRRRRRPPDRHRDAGAGRQPAPRRPLVRRLLGGRRCHPRSTGAALDRRIRPSGLHRDPHGGGPGRRRLLGPRRPVAGGRHRRPRAALHRPALRPLRPGGRRCCWAPRSSWRRSTSCTPVESRATPSTPCSCSSWPSPCPGCASAGGDGNWPWPGPPRLSSAPPSAATSSWPRPARGDPRAPRQRRPSDPARRGGCPSRHPSRLPRRDPLAHGPGGRRGGDGEWNDGHITFSANPIDFGPEVLKHVRRLAEVYPNGVGAWLTVFAIAALGGLVLGAVRGRSVTERVLCRWFALMIGLAFVGALFDQFPFGLENDGTVSLGGRHALWMLPGLAFGLAVVAQRVWTASSGAATPARIVVGSAVLAGAVVIVAGGYEDAEPAPFPGSASADEFALDTLGPDDLLIVTGPSTFDLAISTDTPTHLEDTPTHQVGFSPVYEDPRFLVLGQWTPDQVTDEEVQAAVAEVDRVVVVASGPVGGQAVVPVDQQLADAGFTRSTHPFEWSAVQVWTRPSAEDEALEAT